MKRMCGKTLFEKWIWFTNIAMTSLIDITNKLLRYG